VQQRQPHREPLSDLCDRVVPDGVAGDVDDLLGLVAGAERESDHRPAIGLRRPVARRCRGDAQRLALRRAQLGVLPGRQPDGARAQPRRSLHRRQHPRGAWEQRPAGVVEVVEVVVVVEQHRIDPTQLAGRYGRRLGLAQRVGGKFVRGSRWVKGGIGEQPQAVPLKQRGRPAQVGESRQAVHGRILSVEPA
jgi:hypothetical protein